MDDEFYCFEDEKGNPITERKFGPSSYVASGKTILHNPWVCSFCLKMLRSKKGLENHIKYCFTRFRDADFKVIFDGTVTINMYSDEEILKIIENLGYLSKLEQELDFSVTSINTIKAMDKRVICKIVNGRPVGYIAFCKRSGLWIIEDFFVIKHMRNKGYGKELFEKVLNYTGETRYTIFYNKPNEKMIEFLKGIDTDVTKIKKW